MTLAERHPSLTLIDREWSRMDRLVDRLNAEDMERPAFDSEYGGDPYTTKDLLVHIAAWKRNTLRVIDMIRTDPTSVPSQGTPDEILDVDVTAFNRETFLAWRSRPLSEALAEHRAAHEDLIDALEALPAEAIPMPTSPNIWVYPAIWHPRIHRLQIIDVMDELGSGG